MQTAAIYIKTEPEVKANAQRVAKQLGLSLSSLVNGLLRQLIKTKKITFSATDEIPNEYLKGVMRQAKKNLKTGNHSPIFDNAEDAIAWLHRD